MKRFALVVAATLALVASRATAADEPYVIYGSLPSTGSGAFLGSAEIKTVALIEKLTNAAGGIGGRPIHFEILDDATDPQQAVQIANGFLAKHAAVMIGPALTVAGETYYARAQLKPGPVKTAVEAFYKAAAEANLPIEESQAEAWDSTMIVIDALRHLGLSTTAPQVRAYIAGLTNYAGIDGMYDFKAIPQRGIDDRDAWVMHWDSARHQLVILGGAGGAAR